LFHVTPMYIINQIPISQNRTWTLYGI